MDPDSEAPRLGSIEILEATILYQVSLQEAIVALDCSCAL